MKQIITEAEDRIKLSNIKNLEQIVDRDFALEMMKEVENNIMENIKLILYIYINERDGPVKDILSISRHSWRTTPNIQASIIEQTSSITNPINITGAGDDYTRSFDSLMRRCQIWLENISYEFTDQAIAIIDLTKKLAHGRIGDFNVIKNMNGAENYVGALCKTYNKHDDNIQSLLSNDP
jgi:hypothetical protein